MDSRLRAALDSIEKIGNWIDVSVDELKRINLYIEWITEQCKYFEREQGPLRVHERILPKTINSYIRTTSDSKLELLFQTYYFEFAPNTWKRNEVMLDSADLEYLIRKIVLVPRNVVWVDFGFNVGMEFGGPHPAIIIRNFHDTLLVAPLSSGNANPESNIEVDIPMVYGFQLRLRMSNVCRVRNISIHRVQFHEPSGSVHSKTFTKSVQSISKFSFQIMNDIS